MKCLCHVDGIIFDIAYKLFSRIYLVARYIKKIITPGKNPPNEEVQKKKCLQKY